MPLFFQLQVNPNTQLAIWKIAEAEPFFSAHVPLQRTITHPHKRLQHLAGRYLLKYLFPHFPIELIQVADTRKPFLENDVFHFSISHCGDFAAVIVSTENRVGVDIELVTDKIQRIQHKFVTEREMVHVHRFSGAAQEGKNMPLTLIWSCKEALFKWYGLGEVDFKKHLQLQGVETVDHKLFQMSIRFTKEEDRLLGLDAYLFTDLCLSYVVT